MWHIEAYDLKGGDDFVNYQLDSSSVSVSYDALAGIYTVALDFEYRVWKHWLTCGPVQVACLTTELYRTYEIGDKTWTDYSEYATSIETYGFQDLKHTEHGMSVRTGLVGSPGDEGNYIPNVHYVTGDCDYCDGDPGDPFDGDDVTISKTGNITT